MATSFRPKSAKTPWHSKTDWNNAMPMDTLAAAVIYIAKRLVNFGPVTPEISLILYTFVENTARLAYLA